MSYPSEPRNSLTHEVHEALRDPAILGYFSPNTIPLTAILGAQFGVLGYAIKTANQTGISTETDLTNLSAKVEVGVNRLVLVVGLGIVSRSVADGTTIGDIQEDGVTVGRWAQHSPSAATEFNYAMGAALLKPRRGKHTYNLALERFSGTGTVTLNADAGGPAFLLVLDLGPDPGEQ